MATKIDLPDWVHAALVEIGGSGTLTEVAKVIWKNHEADLRASGDLFYTWQYDMRWAANKLRHTGRMKAVVASPRGIWQLV